MVDASRSVGDRVEVYAYRTEDDRTVKGVNSLLGALQERMPLGVPLPGDEVWRRLSADVEALDVIFFHGVFTPASARLASRLATFPRRHMLIAIPHDPISDALFRNRTMRKRLYWAAVERPYMRAVDGVVALAPSHVQLLRAAGVEAPIVVVPPGLGPEEFEMVAKVRQLRRHRTPPQGRLAALFMGRWDVYEKSLDLVLEAVGGDAVLRDVVDLTLIGPDMGHRDVVHRLTVEQGVSHVRPIGFVSDVWTHLAEADVLLLPSRKEGFGLAALQALACGVPVLLSNSAGFAEYVDESEGVVLVQPDVMPIRMGLHRALEDRASLTSATAAFAERAPAAFSWLRMTEALREWNPADAAPVLLART
jgi:glycosyltransferase involved in cell wall biosynthesis